MFVFLFIYILFFCIAFTGIVKGHTDRLFLFIVLSLPLYFTALSIAYLYGLRSLIPFFQSFKELIILTALCALVYKRKKKLHLQLIDWLVIAYFAYTLLYTLLPLGTFRFMDRLLAFKSLSFFPLVYFTGRLMDVTQIDFNRYFSIICIVAILAGCVLIMEWLRYEHLQVHTGYAEFNQQYFNQDPGGNFGLSWTFETSLGLKRFASFYGGPLELGVNTICTVSVLTALSTRDNNRFVPNNLMIATMAFSLLAIFMALSRAAFASYFLLIYVYAYITYKRGVIKLVNYGFLGAILLVTWLMQGDIYDWIMNTIDFSDSSSAFHVLQWLDGIQAITSHPLGLGMGMSGRVAAATDSNIGGENQLIILGVQTGLLSVLLYISIYVMVIGICRKVFRNGSGKIRKPALALFLIKICTIVPMLTANTESYMYFSYFTWTLSGIVVSIWAEHRYAVLPKPVMA